VIDLIALMQVVMDALQQGVVIVGRHDMHMQRHDRLLAHLPQMHMMHIAHLWNIQRQIPLQLVGVNGDRRAFQQLVQAFFH